MDLSFYSAILGRCLLAAFFIYAAYHYARDWQPVALRMRERKILLPTLCLWLAIAFYFFGGIALLIGYKVNIVASIFIFIIILANVMYRRFWCLKGKKRRNMLMSFMLNTALVGALVLVLS